MFSCPRTCPHTRTYSYSLETRACCGRGCHYLIVKKENHFAVGANIQKKGWQFQSLIKNGKKTRNDIHSHVRRKTGECCYRRIFSNCNSKFPRCCREGIKGFGCIGILAYPP